MFDFATAAHEYDLDHPKEDTRPTTEGNLESIKKFLNRAFPALMATGQALVSTYNWPTGPTVCVTVVGSLEVNGSTHYYQPIERGPGLEARIRRNLNDWQNN